MAELSRDEVIALLGPLSDVVVAEIIATGIMSFSVPDDSSSRGQQFILVNPSRNDLRHNHVAQPTKNCNNLISRQLRHSQYSFQRTICDQRKAVRT